MNLSPGARSRLLTPAVLAMLVAVFVADGLSLLVGLYPPQLSDVQWRFASAQQLLGAGPQMAFLLAMMALTAVYGGHYKALRRVTIAVLLVAVVMLAVTPFFGLDLLSARRYQPKATVGRFTRDGLRIALSSGVLGLAMLWAGRLGLAASNVEPDPRKALGGDLVVAQNDPVQ